MSLQLYDELLNSCSTFLNFNTLYSGMWDTFALELVRYNRGKNFQEIQLNGDQFSSLLADTVGPSPRLDFCSQLYQVTFLPTILVHITRSSDVFLKICVILTWFYFSTMIIANTRKMLDLLYIWDTRVFIKSNLSYLNFKGMNGVF